METNATSLITDQFLSQFSKTLEKVFKINLFTDIKDSEQIDPHTYTEMTEDVIRAMDDKNIHWVIYCLFIVKKAFDTINHEILINKLEQYGIRGLVLNWVRRCQYVELGDYQ